MSAARSRSPTMAMASDDEESRYNYRLAKPLPFELRQHCGIYFEEKLCPLPSQNIMLTINKERKTANPLLVAQIPRP